MKKDEIINTLQIEKQFLEDNYGVVSIALFGSYAKGLENKESDIDFIVEFKEPSYSLLMGLYSYLENKLNSKIDIVRKGPHLSDRFLNTIKNEMIYV
ncbi:nucleotidyltransferase family protein [Flavobacterium cellulosilyticum]|uniref:Toxin-antitoxin system toxin subunit n=1 Tax=Flavobacterium cellulosilyticum TaxID=2541731 RepID=A0A4R5C5C9_9FLAO|nr:nucleotidyltransferase domain-containing protein [Flavobacterium cellulosilyticum]TDD94858.1 toxin-antitoxin system toxin subunit [Flavobacterium cellulosilyticum]